MKHLLLTTALIAAGASGTAFAETAMKTDEAAANGSASAFMTQQEEGQVRASDFLGMRVYAAANSGDMTDAEGAGEDWEDIGEINDVVMSRDGQIEAVLVDIGGFLGMGERQVAVNLDQVQFVSDSSTDDAEDFFLVLNADPATLENAPEFGAEQNASMESDSEAMTEETDTAAADTEATEEPVAEEVTEETADASESMEETGEDVAAAADNAAEETGEAVEDGAENVAQAAENTGEAVEEGAEDMAQSAEAAGEQMEDGAEDMAQSAEATGEQMEEGAEDMASDASEATETDGDAAATATATASADTEMTDEAASTDTTATADATGSMTGTPVEDGYMTAENLDGARVYDSNDKWVGEISDLVLADDGQITDAIVDVGGFLGIGEKPVALKLSDLQILRQDGSEEVRIYTALAEEELKSMPEFEEQ